MICRGPNHRGRLFWLGGALAVACCAVSTARADDTDAFDATTGYRIARYRAPVHEPPRGGQRVTIEDLDRLVAQEGAILLDVMPAEGGGPAPETGEWHLVKPRANIPGSVWLADVGRGRLTAEMDEYFRAGLERLTAGDTSRPIVVYCQSDCWMAWNAIKRAAAYGYRRLYWYPEGSDGWRDHDRPLVAARPVPVSARPPR